DVRGAVLLGRGFGLQRAVGEPAGRPLLADRFGLRVVGGRGRAGWARRLGGVLDPAVAGEFLPRVVLERVWHEGWACVRGRPGRAGRGAGGRGVRRATAPGTPAAEGGRTWPSVASREGSDHGCIGRADSGRVGFGSAPRG